MEASDVKRLKEMEAELSQYKKIVAELPFDNRAMKSSLKKSFDAPPIEEKLLMMSLK